MSEMGHLRPIDDVCAMSAFPPIATDLLHYGNGRKGPKAEVPHHGTKVGRAPNCDRSKMTATAVGNPCNGGRLQRRIESYLDHTATVVEPFWIDHLFLPLGTTV